MGVIGVPAFFVLILGIVALSRGHLTWARITNRRTAGIVTGVAGVVFVTAVALDPPPPTPAAAPAPVTTTTSTAAPATTAVTTTITPAPATTAAAPPSVMTTTAAPSSSAYPPKTREDFQAFARTGDASAIHPYASDQVGAVSICPQPRINAVADISIPARQLLADEAAFAVQRGFDQNRCGGVIFLWNSATENHDGGYTVGRVLLNVSGGEHRLELNTSNGTPEGNFTLTY